jgi:hypothetical protein
LAGLEAVGVRRDYFGDTERAHDVALHDGLYVEACRVDALLDPAALGRVIGEVAVGTRGLAVLVRSAMEICLWGELTES